MALFTVGRLAATNDGLVVTAFFKHIVCFPTQWTLACNKERTTRDVKAEKKYCPKELEIKSAGAKFWFEDAVGVATWRSRTDSRRTKAPRHTNQPTDVYTTTTLYAVYGTFCLQYEGREGTLLDEQTTTKSSFPHSTRRGNFSGRRRRQSCFYFYGRKTPK